MSNTPFEQNIIAMVWDCDKTLISSYMQEPLFRKFNVDAGKFWNEVNHLKPYYAKQGISVNLDTCYLNHVLTYVKPGLFKGLNNKMLRDFGKELSFYPGLPNFFEEVKRMVAQDSMYKTFGIHVEHYVVSTGFAETIRGSVIAPFVDGIFGCEFIETPAAPGYIDEDGVKVDDFEKEITQVACALDNTSKTRYLFEVNKGSNKHPDTIDVNSTIARESRRVPFENMIYIAYGEVQILEYKKNPYIDCHAQYKDALRFSPAKKDPEDVIGRYGGYHYEYKLRFTQCIEYQTRQ